MEIGSRSRGDPNIAQLKSVAGSRSVRIKKLLTDCKEQQTVRCNILLTNQKLEINEILYIKTFVHNHNVETTCGRVLIEGLIIFEVGYLSENQSKQSFYCHTKYYDFIDIAEATSQMIADIKSKVEEVSLINFNKSGRMVTIDVLLTNTALLYNFEEINLITEVEPRHCDNLNKTTINEIVEVVKGCLRSSEVISIGSKKSPIKELIKCDCMPVIQNYKASLGAVKVYGWFNVAIEYLDVHGVQQRIERFVPFNKILAVPKAQDKHMTKAIVSSQKVDCSLLSETSFQLNNSTNFTAYVYQPLSIYVLKDQSTAKEDYTCESLSNTRQVETIIRETIDLNNEALGLEIKDVRVGPVNFLVKQIINNKVLVRGYVDFLIGYAESQGDSAVYIYKQGFFKAVAELNSVKEDTHIELMPVVNFTKAYFYQDKLTIKSLLNIIVRVQDFIKVTTVNEELNCFNNTETEGENEISFLYVMRYNDKLEELATRFGTTVEAIYKLNPQLTKPFENKKIRIPCEVKT